MGDCDLIAPVSEVGRGGVGDGDASVLTARAADRNRERGLTLGHVPGHDDIEEAEPGLHELLRHGIVKDEVRDLLVVAREGSHLGVIEGVREEAHVDHEVGLGGKPVLEAEREDAHVHELLLGEFGEGPAETRPERGGAHGARIDDEVRHLARSDELRALPGDGVLDRLARGGERMAPAVLVIAAHEDLIGRVEEEHLA